MPFRHSRSVPNAARCGKWPSAIQHAARARNFLGRKRFGGKAQRDKRLLILDVERYRYQQFISDLAGMDIHAHDAAPASALVETRNWLATVHGGNCRAAGA